MPDPTQTVQCPHCGQVYSMTDEQQRQYAGQTITCTTCNKPFSVGAVGTNAPQPAPLPPYAAGAQAVEYGGASTATRTDGMSIASLVCGLLLCIPILPGLLATIFGIIGITRTREPNVKGRGLAIAGLVLGIFNLIGIVPLLMISILLPSLNRARETANRVKCASNMRIVGQALLLYANENRGLYPPDLESLLLTQDISSNEFCCPSSNDEPAPGATADAQAANLSAGGHLSYIYAGAPFTSSASADVIVMYEPLTNHDNDGVNMLFGDGHVEFVARQVAQSLITQVESGNNPPGGSGVEVEVD